MPAGTCIQPVPDVPGAALDQHVPCVAYVPGVPGALIGVDVPCVVRVPNVPGVHGTPVGLDVPRVVRVPGVIGTLVSQRLPCVVRVPGVPGDSHTQDQRLVTACVVWLAWLEAEFTNGQTWGACWHSTLAFIIGMQHG